MILYVVQSSIDGENWKYESTCLTQKSATQLVKYWTKKYRMSRDVPMFRWVVFVEVV